MPKPAVQIPAEYVIPINMNGLRGRMLRLPAKNKKKREILLVYGHHTSLERMYGVAEVLNDYGAVTMPDLPGFGGMDSFYTIHEKPTLDNLAGYLASFIKLRYKNKRLTIMGFSFGFIVVTRMLQLYPELEKQVDLLISSVGFSHKDDFTFTKTRYFFYRSGARVFSHKIPAVFFRNIFLHPTVLKAVYHRLHNAKEKFEGLDAQARAATNDFEVYLWRVNDVRTHMTTTVEFLKVDNTKKKLSVPLAHVTVAADKYFDGQRVEQNLRKIFDDVSVYTASTTSHSPSIIGEKKFASVIFPPQLRKRLARKP
ncbi:MAG: alpha/beta hydrolase [Candidatus Saccharibacteria bacterium]|nr:alpha/beta hydrolase [Candidatus Saccharibacteria bacterium]